MKRQLICPNKIRSYRKKHGDTLDELSDAVGICKESLRNYELGFRDIGCEVAKKIARFYNTSLDDLMDFDKT